MYVYNLLAHWGGTERIWADKMNYLAESNGVEVYCITTNQGNHPMPFKFNHNVHHIDLGIQFHLSYRYRGIHKLWEKLNRQLKFESKLKYLFRTIKPDILICSASIYVHTLLRIKGDIPLIAESHEMCSNTCLYEATSIKKKIERLFIIRNMSKVDRIVSLTEGDAQEWSTINKRVTVIPNVVHLNTNKNVSTTEAKKVIFVGRFAKQKGLPSLLEIWDRVHERHDDWQLNIYGEGELKDWLLEEIEKNHNKCNIYVHEPTDHVFDKYCESSIFILTSDYEPFGLVIPEAMSCGLPVIAFDCKYGPADIITDGKDGWLIAEGDINGFADKICRLIERPEERIEMGHNGIASVERYKASVIMPLWMDLFNSIKKERTK